MARLAVVVKVAAAVVSGPAGGRERERVMERAVVELKVIKRKRERAVVGAPTE